MSTTRVYPDGDLAALAWSQGLLPAPPAPLASDEPGAGWRGRLAERWVSEGTLSKTVVKGLLDALARAGRPCECGWVLSLLPAPEPREVFCPRCGTAHVLAADPEGAAQLPGWRLSPPARASQRGSDPGPRTGPGSTLRTHPEGAGSGRPGARSDPSYSERGRRERGPAATRRERNPGATTRDSKGGGGGGLAQIRLGPGDRVGPYVVEEELSRGAMGIVLRAHPEGLPEQRVALKVLQARVSDEEGRARFQREGEAMARLSHPAVVKVHRLDFLPDGNPYLAMELVEGQDLEQSVGEEPVEVGEAARLVAGVAEGVAHLHSRGLIHRDLKLANILLREGRQPVVADFGLVHFLDRHTRLTQAGDLIGTPLYMSPELVRGEAGLTPAADVYALGVMLYRLVAGRYPHEAETTAQLLSAILDEEPALDPAWPAPLRAVLGKALAYEPRERYPDAGALAADVLALHEGREVSARPPGLGRKLARLRRGLAKRPRLLRALGVLAVSAPLVATGLFAYQWRVEVRVRKESEAATREAREFLLESESAQEESPRPWEPLRKRLLELKAGLDPEGDQARALAGVLLEVDQSVARAAVLEALEGGAGLAALAERAAALPLPSDPSLPRAAAFCSARLELRLRTGDLEGALRDRQALGDLAGQGEQVARLRSLYQTLERAQGTAPEAPDSLTAARWALDSARLLPPGPARRSALSAARPLLAGAQAEPGAIAAADPPSRPLPTLHQDVGRSLKLPPPITEVPSLDPLVAERALLALRARALELEPGDRGGRSVLLERLRRLRRDPRRALPPRVLARGLVLEARLGQELGWTSGAVETWRRARQTWVEQAGAFALAPAPALGAREAALLPFDLAARVGELRAASEGLEPEPLQVAAQALVAEVGGAAYRPWREEAEAILAGVWARPQTPAGERWRQLDELAATASPQRVEASAEARRDLCLGEAEVAGAGRALWFERAREAEPCLGRAERHLGRALARGLPSNLTGRAWAGRTLLALRRAQLGAAGRSAQLEIARQALAQAKSHAATIWEVEWAEAALEGVAASEGQGSGEEAAERFLRAAAVAGQSHPAQIVAAGRKNGVLVDGLLALRGAPPLARAKLARALVALAREVRLQYAEEAAWLGVLGRELRAAGQEAEAERAEEERSQALKAQKSFVDRYAKILTYQKDRPDMGTEAEKLENWALILEHPFAAGPLFDDYQRHRPLTPFAEDSLGVAFAVRPLESSRKLCGSICYATVTRKSAHLGAPVSATRALRRLADFGPPNPLGLKVTPPPALLRALLHFEIVSLGEDMDPGVRGRALLGIEAALWESPRSQSVALLEASIRAGVGDAYGAREALRRARWLAPTCRAPRDDFEQAVVPHFIRARSYAVEGRYEEALAALRPLRGAKRGLTSEWLYWERDFRIQRERWAAFPPALIPVYNSLQAEEAARRR